MAEAPDPFEPYLNRAASLYDLGDIVQAGQIWQAILKREPGHAIARAGLYKVKVHFDARATQGGLMAPAFSEPERREEAAEVPAAPEAAAAEPAPDPAPPAEEAAPQAQEEPVNEAEQLVLSGVQLYDLGMTEEAVEKWQRALALNPAHEHAAGYLQMALRDQEQAAAKARPPAPAPQPSFAQPPPPAPPALLEERLQEAESLLKNQRFEEAAQHFQRLLEEHPEEARVYHGYQQARALAATEAARMEAPQAPPPRPVPQPVGPPKALTSRATPLRDGPQVPGTLHGLGLPNWLTTPRNLILAAGAALVIGLGLYFLLDRVREAALKQAVTSAKADAMVPVQRQLEVPSLLETPESLGKEAHAALSEDPFLAYCRAQEWLRLDPVSAEAPGLLEKARARMATLPPDGTFADFRKMVQAGDLEAAAKIIQGLLRQAPDELALREQARSVNLALAQYYATKERFGDAKDCLSRVRAMFPQEKIWHAKLKLLETIQAMPKAERAGWIQMLG